MITVSFFSLVCFLFFFALFFVIAIVVAVAVIVVVNVCYHHSLLFYFLHLWSVPVEIETDLKLIA